MVGFKRTDPLAVLKTLVRSWKFFGKVFGSDLDSGLQDVDNVDREFHQLQKSCLITHLERSKESTTGTILEENLNKS